MADSFQSQVSDALLALADPVRATAMSAYMRDQFSFLGIATPVRRQALRPLLKTLNAAGPGTLLGHARELWSRPQREYQYVALDLLSLHWKKLNLEHIPSLLELAQLKSWWDSVDGLAGVIGEVLRFSHAEMDEALQHENMWLRRIAMLHQLGWRDRTDCGWLFKAALHLGSEKEFFIQKAIGWALRDYARHAPQAVREFIQLNRDGLSSLSYREASKHLGP
ncbi:DNA alkylation repair protein [Oxalobacteraceae bacterium]|nr:DNA alkylation repair protein [Oxalobacteraceae bacterium]